MTHYILLTPELATGAAQLAESRQGNVTDLITTMCMHVHVVEISRPLRTPNSKLSVQKLCPEQLVISISFLSYKRSSAG